MIFAKRRHTGRLDLEAVEMATRAHLHQAGAAVLTRLLQSSPPSQRCVPCPCGEKAHYRELRRKQIVTVLGAVEVERPYYRCAHCHRGQSPQDVELDVQGTAYSPAVRRMMALVGSQSSFDSGRQQLELLAGLLVTTKGVERQAEGIGADIAAGEQGAIHRAFQQPLPPVSGPEIPVLYVQMDGTGVPMVGAEVEGRAGKVEGQPAHTREAKLGCVFTQTDVDPQGRPVRDEASTTYTGAIETAEEFGRRLYTEAQQRGWRRARKKVVIGDGAVWIWSLAQEHFPEALEIVDLYHARQHLWDLAAQLFPSPSAPRQAWIRHAQGRLDRGHLKALVAFLRSSPPPHPQLAHLLQSEADYFERNAHRMRYPAFRQQGLFVGSGVIEAGCKTVIASRLKQSGMFWTVPGATAIIALRCNRLSGKFQTYWKSRSRAA